MMRRYPHFLNLERGTFVAVLLLTVPLAVAQESFRVELGQDGETIADMRPVFLTFESRAMPSISPAEVARRYQRLFDSTDEPEVRIDALNRLANIQNATGQVSQPDDAEEQRRYREVLGSYESIVERGAFQGKLDELLYQMAKAHAYVGQGEESIQRLKQLVGLYPRSDLVPEARFRIAESAFSSGHYAEAEAEYGRLIAGNGGDSLKIKARYMQGWSQYKQGAAAVGNAVRSAAWNRSAASFLTVLDQNMRTFQHIARLSGSDRELVDDTLRILALMAAGTGGTETLSAWLEDAGAKSYDFLLFDRLADYYASQGDDARSVAVNRQFVAVNPEHSATPAFMAQTVDVWQQAGKHGQARQSRGEFVAAFRPDRAFQQLDKGYRDLWRTYARGLADYYYDQGQDRSKTEHFATAAGYYESLSGRVAAPGEILRLAGDAHLQAEHYPGALKNYRQAAYHTPGYEAAADAAWAAVTIQREAVEARIAHTVTLQELSAEAERFESGFQNDPRTPGLYADIANRWLARERYSEARRFAERVQGFDESAPDERYSAWLVLGEVFTETADHQLAEHAWRQADSLINTRIGSTALAGVNDDEARKVKHQLAAAVYRQGEAAQKSGDTDRAVAHFQRVDSVLPGSDMAIKGRYDAANSLMLAERWQRAINELIRFRSDFPAHQLTAGVSDKLVLAYTSSDQPIRAASELMETAEPATDPWPRQLRAAELYHQGEAFARRNAIYRNYLAVAERPLNASEHVRLQTIRKRLLDADESIAELQAQMVSAELASPWHSEETLRWSAASALALGRSAADEFEAIKLEQPLQQTLARKQAALARAQQRFAEAEGFDQKSVAAETLYRRAELYRSLARDLMDSAIPQGLNELEQAQYQMLLEEEAYPFEEKAIELHARNHQRLADGGYSEWIEKSLQALADMFPGRYDRDVQWMTWSGEPADDA